MTTRNDITGDKIQTKPASTEYDNNYDQIFGTPLYNIPPNSWVERDGHKFFFCHVDGMYSLCHEVGGGISHYNATMKVKLSEAPK